jgi:uncharacterized membrane protein
MKKLMVSALVLGLVAFTGCNTSPTGGGGAAGGTFTITAPKGTTEVLHGKDKTVELTIDRKKDFKEDVVLSVKVDPEGKGVTAKVNPEKVKGGDAKTAELTVSATDKANKGKYTVTVTGKPAKGDSTSVDVTFEVPEKK